MITGKSIQVSFRFDDPKASSDHELEARVLEVFRRFGFPVTVGVVPFSPSEGGYVPLCRGDVPHLFEAHAEGRIEVALHGYWHKAISLDAQGVPSEFYGIDPARQLSMMRDGKAVLEDAFGVPMRGFIPPWNTHDSNTIEAASELGFSYLSCGVQAGSRIRNPLVIPKTCSLRPTEARAALASAKRHRRSQPAVVFVFHPDNFIEFNAIKGIGEGAAYLSIPELEEILEECAHGSNWITVCTLADLADDLGQASSLWTAVEFDFVQRASWGLRKRCPIGFLSTRSKLGAVLGVMEAGQ